MKASKSLAQFLNTQVFNTRHQRSGTSFQGVYQSVYIESDEQLIQVFCYILLNLIQQNLRIVRRLSGLLIEIGSRTQL